MDLQLEHQLSRHVAFALNASGGTYTYRFGYTGGFGSYDPFFTQQSTANFFDSPTIFPQTSGRLIYRKNARLSFAFGGGALLVRRRSSALYGATGYNAGADMSYRLARFMSVGTGYGFIHYDFLRVFGGANIHTAAGNFAMRLSKSWEMGFRAGVFRAETQQVVTVAINPVIAAITGQTAAVVANYSVVYSPMFNVRLNHAFRRGGCVVSYGRGATPGNGVFLTSRTDTAGFDCSYTAQRRWNLGAGAAYSKTSALGQTIGAYEYMIARAGASRTLAKGLSFSMGAAMVNDLSSYNALGRQRYYQATVGFAYSPGELPLTLW
jgi:hypothetical protein